MKPNRYWTSKRRKNRRKRLRKDHGENCHWCGVAMEFDNVKSPQSATVRAAAKAYFDILTNPPHALRKLKPGARYWTTTKDAIAKLPGAVRKTFPTCTSTPAEVDSPPRP